MWKGSAGSALRAAVLVPEGDQKGAGESLAGSASDADRRLGPKRPFDALDAHTGHEQGDGSGGYPPPTVVHRARRRTVREPGPAGLAASPDAVAVRPSFRFLFYSMVLWQGYPLGANPGKGPCGWACARDELRRGGSGPSLSADTAQMSASSHLCWCEQRFDVLGHTRLGKRRSAGQILARIGSALAFVDMTSSAIAAARAKKYSRCEKTSSIP